MYVSFAAAGAAGASSYSNEWVVGASGPSAVAGRVDANAVLAAGGWQFGRRRRQRVGAATRAGAEVRHNLSSLVEASRCVRRAVRAVRRLVAVDADRGALCVRVSVVRVGEAEYPLLGRAVGHDRVQAVQGRRWVVHNVTVAVGKRRVAYVQSPIMSEAHVVAELVHEGERVGDAEAEWRLGLGRQFRHLVGDAGHGTH